eukprot:CAMPEP_0181020738 /NCGR_PEP_ID=MMETSP1070-20121207/610_1 /TAXON_ID=265543 /ORGANISM="Minutocellus polymorphus, Strain NH13" /LENGTH=107 /DNA_ID=CAMNT_0023097571 /DNA_START=284 /DNA_END=607 /DNA_ORIENTATION=-
MKAHRSKEARSEGIFSNSGPLLASIAFSTQTVKRRSVATTLSDSTLSEKSASSMAFDLDPNPCASSATNGDNTAAKPGSSGVTKSFSSKIWPKNFSSSCFKPIPFVN